MFRRAVSPWLTRLGFLPPGQTEGRSGDGHLHTRLSWHMCTVRFGDQQEDARRSLADGPKWGLKERRRAVLPSLVRQGLQREVLDTASPHFSPWYCSPFFPFRGQQNQLFAKSSRCFCLSTSFPLLQAVEAASGVGLGQGHMEKGGQPEEGQSDICASR